MFNNTKKVFDCVFKLINDLGVSITMRLSYTTKANKIALIWHLSTHTRTHARTHSLDVNVLCYCVSICICICICLSVLSLYLCMFMFFVRRPTCGPWAVRNPRFKFDVLWCSMMKRNWDMINLLHTSSWEVSANLYFGGHLEKRRILSDQESFLDMV